MNDRVKTKTDEEVLAAKITLMAAAAQCDIVRHRPREPLPTGVVGYKIGIRGMP